MTQMLGPSLSKQTGASGHRCSRGRFWASVPCTRRGLYACLSRLSMELYHLAARTSSWNSSNLVHHGLIKHQAALGRKLAEMHKAGESTKGFGFDVENTIGSTPQINTWTSDWIEFYGVHRLGYQLKLARQQFGDSLIYEKGQRLIKNMAPLFNGAVLEPCLLHGDLWSGNISYDKTGEPLILDPACYFRLHCPNLCCWLLPSFAIIDGHNEAEFGMSWCAGFVGSFYDAYFEVMPKQTGWEERRDLYTLYHYLNHYNLFGSGYRPSAMGIIDDYLRMLGA
ncbi:protein-ribulosamine 3-kinase, chloroplastic isoform X3 [Salvia splendens]|uniref:protein-ribulosamine 3-kinase, chloroplastic isoform X3 n=1 Tax=Salvia splendens TaxID=180675 RepID=UPI001C2734AC|nr:protein-ribulosamine 3-kinase, chloroplastic isoform X3 [Salvia splendens]